MGEQSTTSREPIDIYLDRDEDTKEGVRSDIKHDSPDYRKEFPARERVRGPIHNQNIAWDMAHTAKPYIDDVLSEINNGESDSILVGTVVDGQLRLDTGNFVDGVRNLDGKFTTYKDLRAKVAEGYRAADQAKDEFNKAKDKERQNAKQEAIASIKEMKPTDIAEVYKAVDDNPDGYAHLVKLFKGDAGWDSGNWKGHVVSLAHLRLLLRGIAAAGHYPRTDTSDTRVKRSISQPNRALPGPGQTQVIAAGGYRDISVKRDEDCILMGEIPDAVITGGQQTQSFDEYLENFIDIRVRLPEMINNFTARERRGIANNISDEQSEAIAAILDEARGIANESNNERHEVNKNLTYNTRTFDERRAQSQEISSKAVADMKRLYLQLDAYLGQCGVPFVDVIAAHQ